MKDSKTEVTKEAQTAIITTDAATVIVVEPTEPVGIENLKKAIKASIDLARQLVESGRDGWQWTDSFAFIDELSQMPGVIKSGAQILLELKNLDPVERDEINLYVVVEFDIENDKVEAIVEDSLAIAFSIVSLMSRLK